MRSDVSVLPAASAARPPRVIFAFGCCMRDSAYKIGRTGRGLALKCNTWFDKQCARIARASYIMRHACSMTLFGHANVRKICTTNIGHRARAAALLSILRWHHTARLLAKLPAIAGSSSEERRRVRRDRAASALQSTWRGRMSNTRPKSALCSAHTPARGPARGQGVLDGHNC